MTGGHRLALVVAIGLWLSALLVAGCGSVTIAPGDAGAEQVDQADDAAPSEPFPENPPDGAAVDLVGPDVRSYPACDVKVASVQACATTACAACLGAAFQYVGQAPCLPSCGAGLDCPAICVRACQECPP